MCQALCQEPEIQERLKTGSALQELQGSCMGETRSKQMQASPRPNKVGMLKHKESAH